MIHKIKKQEKTPAKKKSNKRVKFKLAESVNARVAESGLACDSASLGFEFSFLPPLILWRVLGSAELSDADLYQDKHTLWCQMVDFI